MELNAGVLKMKKRGKFKKTTTRPDPKHAAQIRLIARNKAEYMKAMFDMAAFGSGIMHHIPFQKVYEVDSGPETYIH